MPLVIGLVAIVGAVLLLTSGITDASFADVLTGKAGQLYRQNQTPTAASGQGGAGPSASSTSSGSTGHIPVISGSLPALGEGVALTGAAADAWAAAILHALGAPTTQANLHSMLSWFAHEGGGGANNPMNTTLDAPGATGSINSVGVKSYASPAYGVGATVQTLLGGYPAIVSALRSGAGLSAGDPAVSSELSAWSGGGYSSL